MTCRELRQSFSCELQRTEEIRYLDIKKARETQHSLTTEIDSLKISLAENQRNLVSHKALELERQKAFEIEKNNQKTIEKEERRKALEMEKNNQKTIEKESQKTISIESSIDLLSSPEPTPPALQYSRINELTNSKLKPPTKQVIAKKGPSRMPQRPKEVTFMPQKKETGGRGAATKRKIPESSMNQKKKTLFSSRNFMDENQEPSNNSLIIPPTTKKISRSVQYSKKTSSKKTFGSLFETSHDIFDITEED